MPQPARSTERSATRYAAPMRGAICPYRVGHNGPPGEVVTAAAGGVPASEPVLLPLPLSGGTAVETTVLGPVVTLAGTLCRIEGAGVISHRTPYVTASREAGRHVSCA